MRSFKTLLPCEASLVLMALCLWLVALLDRKTALQIGAIWIGAALLMRRFNWKIAMIWWPLVCFVLCGSAWIQKPEPPTDGIYTITNIRSGYAIASRQRQKAVVYEIDNLGLDQKVKLSQFEAVHSQNNEGLFSFQAYLHAKGIDQSAAKIEPLASTGFSLRGKVWEFVHSRPSAALYRLLFYGLSEDENLEWIENTGLPLMALVFVVRKRLSYHIERKKLNIVMAGLQGLLLILFPIRDCSIRLFVFQIASAFCTKWTHRWPLSIIGFLWLAPYSADSLSLVLPGGISFFVHFVSLAWQKKVVQILWIALCQMIWLGKLNVLMVGMFLWFRTFIGWLFLLSLPGLLIPAYGECLAAILNRIQISLEWCTVFGSPPLWYLVLAAGLLLGLVWKWRTQKFIRLLVVFCLFPWSWNLDPFFHVYQMDVGQGDGALIVEPFQKSVTMIDAAGKFNTDQATKLLIPFLQSHQIRKIDTMIVTHDDFDHSGAVDSLKENFVIRKIIRTTQDLFNDPSILVEEEGPGKPAKLNVDYEFWFLLNERRQDEEENDKSLVCLFQYDGFRYLYTGDASSAIEKQLLEIYDLSADLLKLGHHGSKTSSNRDFLKAVDPSLALISAGYQNRYGHPSVEVLQTLNELGIDRLNTADHGSIHLFSLPHLLFVYTADGLLGWVIK
ncbi:MBL fold metallo-hydrolase [Erysipelotrichaceae bacterium RD49]|nr:MBL fold metallo-hydrolase [Erysipelotrichaceae bacterium RD49]